MESLKIALCQIDPTIGDLAGNYAKIVKFYTEASEKGADLAIFPECILTGYPLEDLVLRPSFVAAADAMLADFQRTVAANGKTGLLYGAPTRGLIPGLSKDNPLYNAAILIDPANGVSWTRKSELPNYGVFDEKRVFTPGDATTTRPFSFRGVKLGVMICEDAWFARTAQLLAAQGSDILICINGSPFEIGKQAVRQATVLQRVIETKLPMIYLNQVGGQDELVFDGASFVIEPKRHPSNGYAVLMEPFVEACEIVNFEKTDDGWRVHEETFSVVEVVIDNATHVNDTPRMIYEALVLGIRDYVTKQNYSKVLLGVSGGIDSGLVATLAVDALGAENVLGVRLPSKFSSPGSLTDAADLCQRLGIKCETIPIESIADSVRDAITSATGIALAGVADENHQARERATILMALSNALGAMVLTTGNRTELAVGYFTLAGDSVGGFAPLKDVYKTTVFELAKWRNLNSTRGGSGSSYHNGSALLTHRTDCIPEAIITKPPSAELAPDQKDSDSLPPYDVLDEILKHLIDDDCSIAEAVSAGFPIEQVQKVASLLRRAEYKRRQTPPGIKVSGKLFNRERRYPIVNRYVEGV